MKKGMQTFLYVLFAMMLYIALQAIGPGMETKFWPVYSRFVINNASDTPEGLKLETTFTKHRDCSPQGYGWYLGEFGLMKQVLTRSADVIQHRPLGRQTGTFVIKELRTKDLAVMYAEVYHYCHSLWTTRSVIFP